MSWLEKLVGEITDNLASNIFADASHGFEDIERVIALVEKAIDQNAVETAQAGHDAARTAAADPFHSFVKKPVFAPMAVELWKAQMTFPRVLRSSLLIAIYSHVEFMLRRWCEASSKEGPIKFDSFPRSKNESYPHHYVRYLRDGVGLALGDFEQWPEWGPLDAYRRARNCLAHNGGIVTRDDDRAKIRALPSIEIDESGLQLAEPLVHLMPGACEAAASTGRSFLDRLTKSASSPDDGTECP